MSWELVKNLPPPRVAFFDLDGTLVGADGKITEASRRAIDMLRAHGVAIAIASGRPYFGALDVINTLKVTEVSLFFSGALLLRPRDQWVMAAESLCRESARAIIEAARGQRIYCEWYTESEYFVEELGPLAQMHKHYLGKLPREARFEIFDPEARILKVVLIAETREQQGCIKEMVGEISGVQLGVGVGAAHPSICFANVTSARARREVAFERLLTHYGVRADEVISIGDAEADIPFLERAGYGIAMGNAPASVQTRARFVTRRIEDEGVAWALNKVVEQHLR